MYVIKNRWNKLPLPHHVRRFPQSLSRVASQHRLKVLVMLVDMPKQLQAWHDALPGIPVEELLAQRLKHLLHQGSQHILLIEVVGIKRRTTDVCPIKQVLNGERIIAFLG